MNSEMKAVLLKEAGKPENLYIGKFQTPEIGPNEILVKVYASALNRADTLQRKGAYPPPPGASPILGLEMSGKVVALGEKVSKWRIGDKVCGLLAGGGYAEYVCIHEGLALPCPQGISLLDAAAIPEVFLTAFQALNWLAKLEAGERVLIHAGASGVGTAGIQLAREMGAEIYVTASGGKHKICYDLGAKYAYDYHKEDFAESVKRDTKGAGVNVIIDFIAAAYFAQNLDVLSMEGRMVLLALLGGHKLEQASMAAILRKRLSITGSTLRARDLDYKIRLSQDLKAFAWPKFASGQLKPIVDSVYDWKDVAEAHHYMEANKNIGKILLQIADEE